MNFLFLQSKGQHAENLEFKEGMQRALTRLGHEVLTFGPGHECYQRGWPNTVRNFKPDVVLCCEDYDRSNWVPQFWGVRALRVFWSMDSHLAFDRHLNASKQQKCQLVLTAVHGYDSAFTGKDRKGVFFPNAYPADLIGPRDEVDAAYDVGFCGNVGNRGAWIAELSRTVGMRLDIGVLGENMVRAINSYRIQFNRNISHDINCRTFETLGCGTMLLTNETPGIHTLFIKDRHLVFYDDMHDCVEKAKYYACHEEDRLTIAKAGYDHALANHSYDARAKTLVGLVEEMV